MAADAELERQLDTYFAHTPMADPYPIYAALRRDAPVHFRGPTVILSKYDDIRAAYGNAEDYSSKSAYKGKRYESVVASLPPDLLDKFFYVSNFEAQWMNRNDGADHNRLRGAAQRLFTPRRVAQLEALVQRVTVERLDAMAKKPVADLVEDLAYHIPLLVVADMLEIPEQDLESIHHWSIDLGRNRHGTIPDAIPGAYDSIHAFQDYVDRMITEKRRSGTPSELVQMLLEEEDKRLSAAELAATFVFLLFAGHETTTNLITIGSYNLARHRDQWELLCEQPELIETAVEELLRFDPPTHMQARLATRDIEVRGVEIPEGWTVVNILASANRDEERFDRPDALDITREPTAHMTFGFGPHFCLGAALARLEGRIFFRELTQRYPRAEVLIDECEWKPNNYLRGHNRVPMRMNGAA